MFGSLGHLGLHRASGLVSKHRFEGCLASRLASRLAGSGPRTLSFASVALCMGRLPPISRTPSLPAGSCLLLGKHAMLPLVKSMQGLRLKHLIFVMLFPKMRTCDIMCVMHESSAKHPTQPGFLSGEKILAP